MSTWTWLNLAVGISIFSTVVLGCLVTLARLQAAHSLHQATTSVCCQSWPDEAGGHQPPRGTPAGEGELVHLLEDGPSLCGRHQRPDGPCRGVAPQLGSLVDHQPHQQACVAGE